VNTVSYKLLVGTSPITIIDVVADYITDYVSTLGIRRSCIQTSRSQTTSPAEASQHH